MTRLYMSRAAIIGTYSFIATAGIATLFVLAGMSLCSNRCDPRHPAAWVIAMLSIAAVVASMTRLSEMYRAPQLDPLSCTILQDVQVPVVVPCERRIRMTRGEARLWAAYVLLRLNETQYLEFGAGGSTELVALRSLIPSLPKLHVQSIDSSMPFIHTLRAVSAIRLAERRGLLSMHHANIGATGSWGRPVALPGDNRTVRDKGLAYVSTARGRFDVIFVDGRWRLACAFHALSLLAPGGILLVHDYERYDKHLAQWYRLHERSGSMAVLVPLSPRQKVRPIQLERPALLDDSYRI